MSPWLHLSLRKLLWVLLFVLCFVPSLSQALNGDDWVLVQRFQNQLKQAEAGDPAAMDNIAQMYELGRGTKPNAQQALQWYERAIKKGQNNARAHLGVMYLEGSEIKRDLPKALSLIKQAAEKNSATAQYYFGQMYEQGEGIGRDQRKAIYWYKQAAKNGYYLAIDRLKTLEHNTGTQPHRTAAASPHSTTTQSASPAQVLLRTIMQGKWQHNGRPSGFLPSTITNCRKQSSSTVTCKSGEQQRNTGDAIISYTTDTTLSGFSRADTFQAIYVNTVLKVKAVARVKLDGEQLTPRRLPNIPLGKQSLKHRLRCALQSVSRLICIKDNNVTDTYTRAK